ncbi:MAG: hypothetical protein ACE5KA_08855 [Nitrososphaerales archaeon]
MIKVLTLFALLSLLSVSFTLKDAEAHFLGEGVFVRDYYVVFTTIPDFPVPEEPSVLAFTIADAKTLGHIQEANVIIKVTKEEKLISTLEEKYVGYDAFIGYTFRDEGQHKVIFQISVGNDPEPVTAEFDVQVQQKTTLTFKPTDVPISGEPSGKIVIEPHHFFEVGVIMKSREAIQFSYTADKTVLFNLHSHDRQTTTDHVILEGMEKSGAFMAPNSGNYYFLWENLGDSDARINYDILYRRLNQTIDFENQSYNISFTTNSDIESVRFNQPMKQLVLKVNTPFLTPGFINMTIPKVLLDGSYDVRGGSAQFVVIEGESESVLLINTDDATHDIVINGTTAIPEVPLPLIIFSSSILILLTLLKIKMDKKIIRVHSRCKCNLITDQQRGELDCSN